jgi:phosphoribosylformylglycinamidine cyclo-ligase
MNRKDVVDNSNIQAGDVIVGLASFGKATYEQEYNGGMGSNGLTSARHDVFQKEYATLYPESYDKDVPDDLIYSGRFKVTDTLPNVEVNVGKLVLSPTRTYAPIMIKVFEELRKHIHGVVHCSGGAQTKVLHFVEDLHVVKDSLFEIPPLFKIIQEESGTDWKEMYKVFNMGHRMEIYMDKKYADEIISIAKSFQVDAKIVGYVDKADKKQVTIKSPFGEFVYT